MSPEGFKNIPDTESFPDGLTEKQAQELREALANIPNTPDPAEREKIRKDLIETVQRAQEEGLGKAA